MQKYLRNGKQFGPAGVSLSFFSLTPIFFSFFFRKKIQFEGDKMIDTPDSGAYKPHHSQQKQKRVGNTVESKWHGTQKKSEQDNAIDNKRVRLVLKLEGLVQAVTMVSLEFLHKQFRLFLH